MVKDRVVYKSLKFDAYKCLRGEVYLQPRTSDRQGVRWAYNEIIPPPTYMYIVALNRGWDYSRTGVLSRTAYSSVTTYMYM